MRRMQSCTSGVNGSPSLGSLPGAGRGESRQHPRSSGAQGKRLAEKGLMPLNVSDILPTRGFRMANDCQGSGACASTGQFLSTLASSKRRP